jgi:hypothetical protein
MRIHYEKINSKKIDKTKIKEDDYYPQLYINLFNNNREIQILIKYFKNLNDNYNIEYDYGKNDFSVAIKKYNMYLSYKDENNEIIEEEINI